MDGTEFDVSLGCLSHDVQLEVGPIGLELRREGQVCTGRWRFRSLQHRDARGIKSEQNSGVECLKTHTLAAPAPWVSLRAPETLSQAPCEAIAGEGSPEPRKTQPNLHIARSSSRPQVGREPPTQSQRSHEC